MLVASLVLGMTMVLVFIIPHLRGRRIPAAARGHGADGDALGGPPGEVTVNFARRNRVLTWLLGGLNYHKEHHLFPLICHVNYPAMSPVVEQTCREFGMPYKEYPSFAAGIAAHYRWLRQMGAAD